MQVKNENFKTRGIYLLPNLLTTAGLFAGFYAVVAAMKGLYIDAAIAIFIGILADAFDGRVARLTQTQTAFGAQYDSLSDMVAFGVAPALVLYSWILHRIGKIGWLAAFCYAVSVALRLARFNTQLNNHDKHYFQGLPSPAGAAMVASMLWFMVDAGIAPFSAWWFVIIAVLLALCMVSNIPYRSFKEFSFKDRIQFTHLLFLVVIFILISLDPPLVLFIGIFGYVISGPVVTLIRLRKVKKARKGK